MAATRSLRQPDLLCRPSPPTGARATATQIRPRRSDAEPQFVNRTRHRDSECAAIRRRRSNRYALRDRQRHLAIDGSTCAERRRRSDGCSALAVDAIAAGSRLCEQLLEAAAAVALLSPRAAGCAPSGRRPSSRRPARRGRPTGRGRARRGRRRSPGAACRGAARRPRATPARRTSPRTPAATVSACSGCHAVALVDRAPHAGADAGERVELLDRRVGAVRDDRARVEQRPVGVGAVGLARPRSGRRGRGRTARARTAPTRRRRARAKRGRSSGASSCACSIRCRRPSGCHVVARLLERVERLAVRAVADRVHGDREARLGARDARSPRAPRRS